MTPTVLSAQSEKSPPGRRNRPPSEVVPPEGLSCLETPDVTRQILPSTLSGVVVLSRTLPVAVNTSPAAVEHSPSFEHAKVMRSKILARLQAEEEEELAMMLAKCGEPFLLHCSSCGFQHLAERRCGRKWCPVCVRKIATQRSLKYERAAALCKWPLFLTLTRANIGELARDDIADLMKRFTKFRRQVFWKKNVVGGVACCEITNTGKGWHPHLHCLLDCQWLAIKTPYPHSSLSRDRKKKLYQRAAQELMENWSKCIGQLLSSVYVKRTTGADIAKEVCKYAVKGSDLVESPDPIGPAIWAMTGTKLVRTFGSFFGKNLLLPEEKKLPLPCPACDAKNAWVTEEQVRAYSRQAFDSRRGKR